MADFASLDSNLHLANFGEEPDSNEVNPTPLLFPKGVGLCKTTNALKF